MMKERPPGFNSWGARERHAWYLTDGIEQLLHGMKGTHCLNDQDIAEVLRAIADFYDPQPDAVTFTLLMPLEDHPGEVSER